MNILVTNDDGIDAIGIKILASKLKKYGNVYVVAPNKHMSGASHSFMLSPISCVPAKFDDEIMAFHSSGTPVDCVRIGNALIDVNFDVAFSGVNSGLNVGTDILYSGTVGAAREALIEGIPSVAISTDFDSFEIVNSELDDVLRLIFENKLYSKNYVLNINFPTKEHKNSQGVKAAIQGIKVFKTKFNIDIDNVYKQEDQECILDNNSLTDVYLTKNGFISLTPLKIEQTDFDSLSIIKNAIE